MKRAALILAALAAILTAAAAPVRTATENFVTNKIAEAVAAIPAPDYSTNNTALVETIQTKAPAPGNYAAVSNRAMIAATEAQLEGYKQKQESVDDPDIDGVEVVAAAIVGITQDANGVIAPVKKTLPTATALYGGQDGLMSGADKAKLDDIAAGAQVNVIEGISVNGEPVSPTDKVVALSIPTVPTDVSAFSNDAGYVTKSVTNGLLAASAAAATYQPKGDYLTEHQSLAPATNYTDSVTATNAAAIALRPTKAKLDEGWWSDWTILRDGVNVTAQVRQPVYFNPPDPDIPGFWNVYVVSGDEGGGNVAGGEDVTTLEWSSSGGPYTATRHRVAAPVPTKPEDIGATSPEAVSNIVRALSLGGIWDAELEVWWTPRMRSGSLTYEATTNVNLNAEN